MPKIVSITDHRSFCRIKASPKFSVEFLQIDLRRDTISLLLELLRGICDDYAHSLGRELSTSVSGSTDRPASPSGPSLFHHLTISRLNVLVLLSKKILVILHAHANLRPIVLNAVFNVLRLVIWSCNRSVRCAGLRCLCYYLHTCSDVRLFLELQLDLVVARCLDLSYVPERMTHLSRQPVPSRHLNPQTSNPGLRYRLPALSSANGNCLPHNSSHDLPTNQPRLRTRRSINPRLCTLRSSQSPSSQTDSAVLDSVIATNIRNTGHLPTSPLVSAAGERQLFLRVAYRLVRLAPHLFPSSLIQAVAAPCLRAARFQASGGGTAESKANKRDPKPAVHFAFRFQQPGLAAAAAVGRTDKANPEDTDSMVQDVALRSCLLIITELIILAPEHIQNLASNSWSVCSESSEHSQKPDSSQLHSSLLPSDSVDHVGVQALMSAFASSLHVNTIHSSRIQEAVLLGLLSLMNVAGTITLVPSRRIAKFFVPFTSMLERANQPRPTFDSHPSFTDCAKLCLTTMLRSWSGLFYFLHEGLPCLQTLMYSLAVGTTEMRNQILDFLSGLFPSLPTLHPSIVHVKTAVLGLSEALARCAPCILPVVSTYPTPTNNSASINNQRSHVSFTQLPRSSGVGDSGSTSNECARSSYVPSPKSAWDLDGGFVAAEGCRIFFKYGSNTGGTIDLMETYTALLLTTLIQAGLYEGLIRAISDPNEGTSVRAGLLFGLLAYKACSLLPNEHPAARRLHHVGLLQPKLCGSQLAVMWLERVHRIMYTHEIQLIDPASLIRAPLHSPFLECLARQKGSTDLGTADGVAGTSTLNGFQSPETWVDHIAVQSGIISIVPTRHCGAISSRSSQGQPVCEVAKDPNGWDWDTLASFGRNLFDLHSMFSWEDKSRMRFLHCLMEFLTPNVELSSDAHPTSSSKIRSASISFVESNILPTDSNAFRFPAKGKDLTHFIRNAKSSSTVTNTFLGSPTAQTNNFGCCLNLAWLPHTWPHASKAALLAAGLIPHLAVYPTTSEPGQLLTKFLLVIRDALTSLQDPVKDATGTIGSPQLSHLFQPSQLSTSCSGLLILAIGRLTCTEVGESRLESVGLYSVFHQLLFSSKPLTSGSSTQLVRQRDLGLLKLLLSSLDFTRPGRLGHQLLTATVNGGRKSARIYLVQFIRLLFRLRLPFLASWCVDLIVKLCLDPCPQIARSALHLLEETCWDTVNVQAITRYILTDPNPPPTASSISNPASTCLTPFGLRLLDPSTGPVGHRIFARLLSSNASFRSLLPTLGSKGSPVSQPSATVIHSLGKTAVKDGPNSTLSDSGFLQTPLEWMLDMARRRYNLAYAAEIDNRLNRLFIGHAPGRDQMTTNKYIDDTVSRRFPWFSLNSVAYHRESVDNSQSMVTARSNEGDADGESDSSAEVDQNRPSNRESSPHYQRDGLDAYSVYYDTLRCLPLPKHLYGCLAEHPAGLDLLIGRGDLQTVLDVLNASSSVYLPCSTSPSSDAPSILATKAALWALAHVGSATSGHLWFTRQQPGLVDLFQRFATEATSTGLRATAWLCLNLLACKPGVEQILVRSQKNTSANQILWVVGRSSTGLTNPVSAAPMHEIPNILFNFANTHANKPIFSVSPLLELGTDRIPNGEVREPASGSDPLVMSVNDKREQNGSLLARAIGNHNSLSLRTTKRWFPRRLSPRIKHPTTTASDSFESANSRGNSNKSSELRYASLSSHSDRAVVRGNTKDGLEEFPSWNLSEVRGLQCDRQGQLLPNPQHRASGFQEIPALARNSATWTHRDLLAHRRSVWELHPTGSTSNPIDNRPAHESTAICFTTVCLPLDVRVLGRSVLRNHRVDEFGPSNDSCSPGSKSLFVPYDVSNARRSLLSFVHVASSAQSVLMHAREIQRQLDQDIGQFDLSIINPINKSGCPTSVTTVDIKTPTKHTSNESVSVPLTDAKICSTASDATLTQCVEHSAYNPCILRHKNDRPSLSNSVSNPTRVWCSNKAASEDCLSRSCRLSSLCRLSALSCTPQETPDDRRTWSRQLFCIVTGLLANVFSTAHEQALHRLIQAAQSSQSKRSDGCPSSSDKPLFDACVYTRVARLLATYTFPLEARVKIQSALLGLEIHELFTDARTAVGELEKAVRSYPGLADVEQSISSKSAIPLQPPQNFHTPL